MPETSENPSQLFFITPVRSSNNIIQTSSISESSFGTVQSDGNTYLYMFDNLISTFYHVEATNNGTINFDFNQLITANSILWIVQQRNQSGDAGATTRMQIQISSDNATWTTLFDHNQILGANTDSAIFNDSTGRQVFRYMRLLATNTAAQRVKIYEIVVTALQ